MEKAFHDMMVRDRRPVAALVDTVARAICKSRTCEGLYCCEHPANMARRSDCPVDRGCYDDAAQAALKVVAK